MVEKDSMEDEEGWAYAAKKGKPARPTCDLVTLTHALPCAVLITAIGGLHLEPNRFESTEGSFRDHLSLESAVHTGEARRGERLFSVRIP